jgi:hypothetical protein
MEKQIILDAAGLGKLVASCIVAQGKQNDRIQTALIQGTQHAVFAGNGDVSALDKLVQGTKGGDRKAIIKWLKKYSCIELGRKGAPATLERDQFRALRKQFDTAAALVAHYLTEQVEHFVDMGDTTDGILAALDVDARVMGLLKTIKEAEASGREIVNKGLAKYLADAVDKYHAEKHPKRASVPVLSRGKTAPASASVH